MLLAVLLARGSSRAMLASARLLGSLVISSDLAKHCARSQIILTYFVTYLQWMNEIWSLPDMVRLVISWSFALRATLIFSKITDTDNNLSSTPSVRLAFSILCTNSNLARSAKVAGRAIYIFLLRNDGLQCICTVSLN